MQDVYIENYKTWLKEGKQDLYKMRQASYVLELEFNKAKIAILPLICTCNKISIKISTFVVFAKLIEWEANHETHMERQRIPKEEATKKESWKRRIRIITHTS